MKNWVSTVLFVLAAAILVMSSGATAFAWNNGPDGADSFGTHDWIAYHATRTAVERGATWVDLNTVLAASDDPDTVLHDDFNHFYERRTDPYADPDPYYGGSPETVAECYRLALESLRAGDTRTASYYVGLLSHYYSDAGDPLHTCQSDAETPALHSSYEAAVDGMLTGPASRGYYTFTFAYTADPADFTITASRQSHSSYHSIIDAFSAGGLAAVYSPTNSALSRCAAGTAKMILSIQADALLDPQPNAVYRFYRPSSGTHLYTSDVSEAASVTVKLSSLYRYEGKAYYADPAKNGVPLYRFYNRTAGTHLYTADEDEKNNILGKLSGTYSLEGVSYYVSLSGGTQVHRFYSPSKGVHFYSADPDEIANVKANLAGVWQYEGPAYCVRQ